VVEYAEVLGVGGSGTFLPDDFTALEVGPQKKPDLSYLLITSANEG
jgi:hypothetical protein